MSASNASSSVVDKRVRYALFAGIGITVAYAIYKAFQSRDRFRATMQRLDDMNGEDPEFVKSASPVLRRMPSCQWHGRRMGYWLSVVTSDQADQLLKIAACGWKVRRWQLVRSREEKERDFKLAQRKFHAEVVSRVMEEKGYARMQVDHVVDLLLRRKKKNQETAAKVQCLEDAVCLVFLEGIWLQHASNHWEQMSSSRIAHLKTLHARTIRKMSAASRPLVLRIAMPPRFHRYVRVLITELKMGANSLVDVRAQFTS